MDSNLVFNSTLKPICRTRTAYAFFVKEQYRKLAVSTGSRYPQLIISMIAKKWRMMDKAQKAPYIAQQIQDDQRYKNAKAQWVSNFKGKLPRYRRKKKKYDMPKRARNPFIYFLKEIWFQVRSENRGWTQQEMIREISNRWKNLPLEAKNAYIQKAVTDKQRYVEDVKEYRAKSNVDTDDKKRKRHEERIINELQDALEPDSE